MKTKRLYTLLALLMIAGCGNSHNDCCWLSLTELHEYALSSDNRSCGPVAPSCVAAWHFDIISDMELIGNDSVRISGTVFCKDEAYIIPVIYSIDTCIDKEYILNPNPIVYGDIKGNYSFTTDRKDGQMFLIYFVGFEPVVLTLNYCDECKKHDKPQSSHVELRH